MMNVNLARLARLASAFALAAALAACGGGGGSPGTPLIPTNPGVQLTAQSGTTVVAPGNVSPVVVKVTNYQGGPEAGVTVTMSIASGTSGGRLQYATVVTGSDGIAYDNYIAGVAQGVDVVAASVPGVASTHVVQSITFQVGQPGVVNPAYAVNFTTVPAAVLPTGTGAVTLNVTSGGQPVSGATVQFSIDSAGSTLGKVLPMLNGVSTYPLTLKTDSNGNANVMYTAGGQSAVDSIFALVMVGDGSPTPAASASAGSGLVQIASASANIAVTPTAPMPNKITLAGTPSSGSCSQIANTNGVGLTCSGVSANTILTSGAQSVAGHVDLTATVTLGGVPVYGQVVQFAMGGTSSSTGLPYCTPPATLQSDGTCLDTTTAGAKPTAPTLNTVVAGFTQTGALGNGPAGTLSSTLIAVTDVNGVATAQYVAGGKSGADTVLVNASSNSGTAAAPALGTLTGAESASITVQ